MLFLLLLERAFGAISILDGYVLRHFPGLPGMPVRRIVEPVQLVGAELVSPADVFAEVAARRGLAGGLARDRIGAHPTGGVWPLSFTCEQPLRRIHRQGSRVLRQRVGLVL